jgi:hypothetical protein
MATVTFHDLLAGLRSDSMYLKGTESRFHFDVRGSFVKPQTISCRFTRMSFSSLCAFGRIRHSMKSLYAQVVITNDRVVYRARVSADPNPSSSWT